MAATGTTAYSGYNAVKIITSTDSADIDWYNVDWEKVQAYFKKREPAL